MKKERAVDAVSLLGWFNAALAASAAALLVYLVLSLAHTRTAMEHRRSLAQRIQKAQDRAQKQATSGAPAFNDAIFRQKNLFVVPDGKKTEVPERDFLLLGVSMGEKTIAVIRDPQSNKIHYCAEGDMIDDYRVRAIQKNSVTLESRRGTMEIYK